LPRTIGTLTLSERTPVLTSVAPFKGKKTALRKALGSWPAPGEAKGRTLWAGRNLVFVVGECPDLAGLAATTDQTDAWAAVTLAGPDMDAVLARLTPLDTSAMAPGQTARSLLGHMSALYHRTGEGMDIYVFRSMAATAVHEISHAMTSVAARASVLS
jgi:sarcosine oxidase subunit gamma